MASQSKVPRLFTVEEVAEHNQLTDCYLIIHGVVYDVTPYLDKHPGGPRLLMKKAGMDATSDFEALFHSARARSILESLFVGILDPSKHPPSLLNPSAMRRQLPSKTPDGPTGAYGLPLGAAAPRQQRDGFGRAGPPAARPAQARAAEEGVFWQAVVAERRSASPSTVLLRLRSEREAALVVPPGHHVTVYHGGAKRHYTPVECAEDGRGFTLLVKRYEEGLLSPYICALEQGGALRCSGPNGTFKLDDILKKAGAKSPPGISITIPTSSSSSSSSSSTASSTPSPSMLLLCGGTGVTAFYPILTYLSQSHPGKVAVTVAYSVTHSDEFLLTPELDALQESVPLHIIRTVTREDEHWKGRRGRIDKALLESLTSPSDILICGPPRFNMELRMLISSLPNLRESIIHLFQ